MRKINQEKRRSAGLLRQNFTRLNFTDKTKSHYNNITDTIEFFKRCFFCKWSRIKVDFNVTIYTFSCISVYSAQHRAQFSDLLHGIRNRKLRKWWNFLGMIFCQSDCLCRFRVHLEKLKSYLYIYRIVVNLVGYCDNCGNFKSCSQIFISVGTFLHFSSRWLRLIR